MCSHRFWGKHHACRNCYVVSVTNKSLATGPDLCLSITSDCRTDSACGCQAWSLKALCVWWSQVHIPWSGVQSLRLWYMFVSWCRKKWSSTDMCPALISAVTCSPVLSRCPWMWAAFKLHVAEHCWLCPHLYKFKWLLLWLGEAGYLGKIKDNMARPQREGGRRDSLSLLETGHSF